METLEDNDQKVKRPVLLTVLAILSLVSISFGLLGSILGILNGPPSAEELEVAMSAYSTNIAILEQAGEPYWVDVMTKMLKLISYTNANFYMNTIIELLAYIVGLSGVIMMLRGRKIGFHLYIIYSLIMVFSIYASAPVSEIPPFYFITLGTVALVFILLYSRTLKFLK